MLVDLLSEDLAAWPDDALDRGRRLPAHPGVGDGGGVRRGHHPAVAGAGPDLDARSPELGVDAQRPLRRGARDRPEHARDERGRGGRSPRRRPRRDELGPARSRGRLACRDRARKPDDDRVAVARRGPRRFPSSCTSSSPTRSTGASSRTAGSASACSRRLRASTASSLRSCSAPERAERVCAEALTLGVLEERGGKLELHPLAAVVPRGASETREATSDFTDALGTALEVYRARREWDAAFEVLDRRGLDGP